MLKKLFFLFLVGATLLPQFVLASNPDVQLSKLQAMVMYLEALVDPEPEPLTKEEMKEIIVASADWIVSSQQADKGFGYEYLPYEGSYTDDNAMVRQAGTFYALAEYYRSTGANNPQVQTALETSIAYFRDHTETVADSDGKFACVQNSQFDTECRLGSSALALLGLLSYAAANPTAGDSHADLIESYKEYLLAAKFEGAGFSNVYRLRTGLANSESPFFNGEAMLALVRYYQYQSEEAVKDAFADTFAYLTTEEKESALYLWIMAALKDAKTVWPNDDYQAYAEDFTAEQVIRSQSNHTIRHNYCAPIEGMVSAQSIVVNGTDNQLASLLEHEIDFWLAKTARLQLHEDQLYRLVMTEEGLQFIRQTKPTISHGGFLTGETELKQRIDFTQHCLSAYVQAYEDIEGWQW